MEFSFNLLEVIRKPISIFSSQELPKVQRSLERIVEVIDEVGIASAKAQGLRAPVTSALKLRQHPDQRIYIMREEIQDHKMIPFAAEGRDAADDRRFMAQAGDGGGVSGATGTTNATFQSLNHAYHTAMSTTSTNRHNIHENHDFRFTTGGLAGYDDMANVGRHVVVGLIKVGTKRLFLVDEYGRQIELNTMCVLDFYINEAFQRQGYGKRLFDFMLAIEFVSPKELCYDRPSEKFLSFLQKHYGLCNYIPQPNNFIVFREFGLGMLELDAKGKPKTPMVLNRTRRIHVRTPAKKQRAEGLLKAYEHITRAKTPATGVVPKGMPNLAGLSGFVGLSGDHGGGGGSDPLQTMTSADFEPVQRSGKSQQTFDNREEVYRNKHGDNVAYEPSTTIGDLTRTSRSESVNVKGQPVSFEDSQIHQRKQGSQVTFRSDIEGRPRKPGKETYHDHLYVPPEVTEDGDALSTNTNAPSVEEVQRQMQDMYRKPNGANAGGKSEIALRAERLLANAAAEAQQRRLAQSPAVTASRSGSGLTVHGNNDSGATSQSDPKRSGSETSPNSGNHNQFPSTSGNDSFPSQSRLVNRAGAQRMGAATNQSQNQNQHQQHPLSASGHASANDTDDDYYFAPSKRVETPSRIVVRHAGEAVPIDPIDGPINWTPANNTGGTVPYTYGRNVANPELAAQEAERKARIRMLMQPERFPHVAVTAVGNASGSTRHTSDAHASIGASSGHGSMLSSVALISGGFAPLLDRGIHGHHRPKNTEMDRSVMHGGYALRSKPSNHGARIGLPSLGLPLASGHQRRHHG